MSGHKNKSFKYKVYFVFRLVKSNTIKYEGLYWERIGLVLNTLITGKTIMQNLSGHS